MVTIPKYEYGAALKHRDDEAGFYKTLYCSQGINHKLFEKLIEKTRNNEQAFVFSENEVNVLFKYQTWFARGSSFSEGATIPFEILAKRPSIISDGILFTNGDMEKIQSILLGEAKRHPEGIEVSLESQTEKPNLELLQQLREKLRTHLTELFNESDRNKGDFKNHHLAAIKLLSELDKLCIECEKELPH